MVSTEGLNGDVDAAEIELVEQSEYVTVYLADTTAVVVPVIVQLA